MSDNQAEGQSCEKDWKEQFIKKLLESEDKKSTHFNVITKDKYSELLKEVEDAERVEKKTPLQHRRLKRFRILEIGDIKKLVERSENNEIKYYLPIEEVYDVIQAAHIAVGHGGRDRMLV